MTEKFEIKADSSGKFRSEPKAENAQMNLPGEASETKQGAERCVESVKKRAPFFETIIFS